MGEISEHTTTPRRVRCHQNLQAGIVVGLGKIHHRVPLRRDADRRDRRIRLSRFQGVKHLRHAFQIPDLELKTRFLRHRLPKIDAESH